MPTPLAKTNKARYESLKGLLEESELWMVRRLYTALDETVREKGAGYAAFAEEVKDHVEKSLRR